MKRPVRRRVATSGRGPGEGRALCRWIRRAAIARRRRLTRCSPRSLRPWSLAPGRDVAPLAASSNAAVASRYRRRIAPETVLGRLKRVEKARRRAGPREPGRKRRPQTAFKSPEIALVAISASYRYQIRQDAPMTSRSKSAISFVILHMLLFRVRMDTGSTAGGNRGRLGGKGLLQTGLRDSIYG